MNALTRSIKQYGLELFGRYYSTYYGYVMDNNDTQGQDRLLVSCPTIWGLGNVTRWAYPKHQFGGHIETMDYGVSCLPEIGEMIMVEFKNGDARYPVWSHGHFISGHKPAEFKNPKYRGFKTPKGNYVLFDDENDEITLVHNKGSKVTINEDLIELLHKDGKLIKIDKDKIYLNGATNGSLINIADIVGKLNTLEERMGTHQHGYIAPAAGIASFTTPDTISNPTIVLTTVVEIEDKDVVH